MKPYMVEITTYAVVMADDEAQAQDIAKSYKRDILSDDPDPEINVTGVINRKEDLIHGWTENSFPYNGNNTRIGELLKKQINP